MKPLERVTATDLSRVTHALRAALSGGAAVWSVAGDPAAPTDAPREVDDDIALVVETSGSTDAPKRVALSADALLAAADATHDALGGPGQWLLALPAHYIAGAQVIVRGIHAGTQAVVLDGEHFDAGAFAAASARLAPNRPHYTSLVPLQLARLVDGADRDAFIAAALRSYDAVLVGGQALAPGLAERAAHLGANVVRTYGSSETAGGCVYDGRALEGVGVRIVDGMVELSGPMLADGYLGDAGRTAAAFTTDARGTRWYRTGDLGDLGDDGRLRVRGRGDDVIISGGVKVVLGEVERAVRAVPGFGEAVVVAVGDAAWGERAAVVAARTDAAATSAALTSLVAATDAAGLTPAARPVRLLLVDAMPLLPSGKPDRRALAVLAGGLS
ncbi:O-succinylbenzoic acid--CoA ligase [Agromyces ramosus]|uniref:O-succinylbenzoic acid--CoA ligase n=1 Tax=Agromyces ramosus TaxID=33879 RepID=A0ABU0R933_9MICO|nr:O-succinylbenzoic acid--CoA ligase [Agromyces ramosus]